MKKTLVVFLLLSISLIFAVESDPSEIVGFVKFSCVTTNSTDLNLISLPFNTGFSMASEVAAAITDCDQVSKWNASTQSWATTVPNPFVPGEWADDFAVSDNDVLMVNLGGDAVDFYAAGTLAATPSYQLVTTNSTNLNYIILPFEKSNLTMASQLATDITNTDAISKWNASNQSWDTTVPNPFIPGEWADDFAISIGMPYVANVTSQGYWPQQPTRNINIQNNIKSIKKINKQGAKK